MELGYSSHDLISRGFIASPEHAALVADTPSLNDVDVDDYDAVFLVGGQGPMYTFRHDKRVKDLVGHVVTGGRLAAVVCAAFNVLGAEHMGNPPLPDGHRPARRVSTACPRRAGS